MYERDDKQWYWTCSCGEYDGPFSLRTAEQYAAEHHDVGCRPYVYPEDVTARLTVV